MNERIFDLDDVRAISDAFSVAELRWVTLPDGWKQVIPHAERETWLANDEEWWSMERRIWGSDFIDGNMVWPKAWVRYTRHVLSGILLDPEHDRSVGLDDLDRRYASIVAERRAHPHDGPHLFAGLEVSWMKRMNTFQEVLDPWWQEAIATNRGGTGSTLYCPGGCIAMEDWDSKSEVEVLSILKVADGWLDRIALNIMTRYLDARTDVALREAAEQAMAEQNDPPVRRPRARL